MARLTGIYKDLLSEKQNRYINLYYERNWSIEEIGEKEDVSRQSVYDVLRRGIRKIEEFEDTLNYSNIKEFLLELKKSDDRYREEIEELLKDVR